VATTGTNNIGQAITVEVTNRSGSSVSPAFTLETASGVSSFWHIANGPKQLRAGASAQYTLTSPDAASQFSSDNGLTVLAFLSKPASVSVSDRYQPALWHVGFSPESIDRLVPLGDPGVTIRAQLLNEWDQPIHLQDVPVTIYQVPGSQGQEIASIDGEPLGRSATVYTDADGAASFQVVGEATSFWELTLSAALPSQQEVDGYDSDSSVPIDLRFRAR
jgi:hypothetical protein